MRFSGKYSWTRFVHRNRVHTNLRAYDTFVIIRFGATAVRTKFVVRSSPSWSHVTRPPPNRKGSFIYLNANTYGIIHVFRHKQSVIGTDVPTDGSASDDLAAKVSSAYNASRLYTYSLSRRSYISHTYYAHTCVCVRLLL